MYRTSEAAPIESQRVLGAYLSGLH
jgi:hypothetical protein